MGEWGYPIDSRNLNLANGPRGRRWRRQCHGHHLDAALPGRPPDPGTAAGHLPPRGTHHLGRVHHPCGCPIACKFMSSTYGELILLSWAALFIPASFVGSCVLAMTRCVPSLPRMEQTEDGHMTALSDVPSLNLSYVIVEAMLLSTL